MSDESAPLLEPREGADARSRRGRIVRVAAAGLLAAGAVVAVAGGSSRDAVALLRSPATKTTMPSVSHREARLGDGRWEEIEEANRLMMAQERLQMQADAQTAAVEQSAFEDREASVARAGPGELASPDPTAPTEISQPTAAAVPSVVPSAAAAAAPPGPYPMADANEGGGPVFVHIPKNGGTSVELLGAYYGRRLGMCAAKDPDEWEGALGYETIPGFKCNVWHRPPLPPATGDTAGDGDGDLFDSGSGVNLGKIANSFCMSRNPYDRLASIYRYKSGLYPDKFAPTCESFSAFLDKHFEKLVTNQLLRCVHTGEFHPSECEYHVRADMAKAEADMDDIEQHSSYSDEDCHFLPQSLYTRTCENVFKVEDYDATVMPYLKEQFAKFGAAAAARSEGASSSSAALGDGDQAVAAMGDYRTDWWWNHVGKYQQRKAGSSERRPEVDAETAAVGEAELAANDGTSSTADSSTADSSTADSSTSPLSSCTWSDVSAETIEHIKFAYQDDFDSLGYSPEPPPGPLDLSGKDKTDSMASLGASELRVASSEPRENAPARNFRSTTPRRARLGSVAADRQAMEAKLEARTTQQRDADEFFAAWLDEDADVRTAVRGGAKLGAAPETPTEPTRWGDAAGQPVARELQPGPAKAGQLQPDARGGGDDVSNPVRDALADPDSVGPGSGNGRGAWWQGIWHGGWKEEDEQRPENGLGDVEPKQQQQQQQQRRRRQGGDPAERYEDPAEKKEPTEAQKRWWMEHHGGVDTRVAPEDTRVAPEDTREPPSAAAPVPEEETPGDADAVDPVTMKRLEEAATACSAAFPKKGKANFPAIIKSHLLEMHRELTAGAAGGAASSTMPSGDSASEASTIPSGAADSDGGDGGASSGMSEEERAIAAEDAAVAKAMEEESAAYGVRPTTESGAREPQPQDHSGSYPDQQQRGAPGGTIVEAAPSETEAAPVETEAAPTETEAAPGETEAAGSDDDMSSLREELKAELKAELKEQLKQELMQDMMKEGGGGGGGVVGAAR